MGLGQMPPPPRRGASPRLLLNMGTLRHQVWGCNETGSWGQCLGSCRSWDPRLVPCEELLQRWLRAL